MPDDHGHAAGPTLPDDWWRGLFAAIDARDATRFTAFLTPDARFRFGNLPEVVGREAIGAAVGQFFAAIGGCAHRLLGTWYGPGSAVCEGEVSYTRLDGRVVTVPFANVFALRGTAIASYRIFIDNTPLFASAAG
jgi:ketosteroid isomerase-like protein